MRDNFAGIQPPDPSEESIWTNPNSGITYHWNDSIKAWDAVSSSQVAQTTETLPLANPSRFKPTKSLPDSSGLSTQKDLNEWIYECLESVTSSIPTPEPPDLSNYATKEDVSTATSALPYRLETDKVAKKANQPDKQNANKSDAGSAHAGGEIQLVDNLGYFHNIRFSGNNGIQTSSNQQGIIIDGSALQGRIKALEDQIELLASLIPPVDYGEVEITGGNDYNENQCWLAPNEEGMFICNLSGSNTHGCRYNWELMRGEGRFSGPTNAQTVILMNQSSAPNTVVLRCTVSHPSTEATVHGEINILVQNAD